MIRNPLSASPARTLRALPAAIVVAGFLLAGAGAVRAQTFSDAFAGFGSTSKHPIEFQMGGFELDEKNSVATLKDGVNIRQQKTRLKTARLKVYYQGSFSSGGLQRISRMVADSRVVITSGDQSAEGDSAIFDMKAEKLYLTGNVVLAQGENVIKGDKLVIDLKTGKSKMESKKQRVIMVISPSSFKNANKAKKN